MRNQRIPGFIVIDDDEVNNILCRKVIRIAYPDADIIIFSEATKALEYFKCVNASDFPKSILFLDLNMPVISGWDFLQFFDALDSGIKDQLKIYILSSSIDPLDKIRSTSNKNIWNYIAKPLTRRAVETAVNKVHEEEAAAFAREIHDELGQQLMRIKMDTSWLGSKISDPDDKIRNRIKEALALVDATIVTVRGINSGLRPRIIDDLGLFAAIEWQANDFSKYSGIPCNVKIDMQEPEYSKLLSGNVFRVFQECLTNIGRHAEATEVETGIKYDGTNMVITIKDNGKGFDPEVKKKGSFGLTGLRERAAVINGSIDIRSEKGYGTTIELSVPIII